MFGSYHPQINSAPHQFVVDLDDIGIWNRALSQEEISVLYNASAPISGCTNTEAFACNALTMRMLLSMAAVVTASSDIPASHCGPGTIWDAEMQNCALETAAEL